LQAKPIEQLIRPSGLDHPRVMPNRYGWDDRDGRSGRDAQAAGGPPSVYLSTCLPVYRIRHPGNLASSHGTVTGPSIHDCPVYWQMPPFSIQL
jgi:hypothetical protein